MTPSPPARRAQCPTCLRPQATCICAFAAPATSPVDLLILQHPLEVANAKNSARLLHLSMRGSRMVAGETFGHEALEPLLSAGGRTPLLLYPDTADDTRALVAEPPALDPTLLQSPDNLRLVALDATWRKSRKMLYLNPLLQQLPRLALRDMPSNYRIRKAHAPDQLSTLEAVAYALAQLDGDVARSDALLAAFERFVTQQAAFTPRLKSA